MKRIVNLFFLLISFSFLVSCSSDDKTGSQWDANSVVRINPAQGVQTRAGSDGIHLTAWEIARWGEDMTLADSTNHIVGRGFAPAQRDTSYTDPHLSMWGVDIIDQNGKWEDNFIDGHDIVITRNFEELNVTDHNGTLSGDTVYEDPLTGLGTNDLMFTAHSQHDTIAYIPNSVLLNAKGLIRAAYDRGDYATVYALFNKAFTFKPITGAEWRALKAKGEE
jgi:hypothetical protein